MLIKKYSDLEKIKDDVLVDLSVLEPRQFMMVISFLAGLTYRTGSLTKIASNKFWIKLGE